MTKVNSIYIKSNFRLSLTLILCIRTYVSDIHGVFEIVFCGKLKILVVVGMGGMGAE